MSGRVFTIAALRVVNRASALAETEDFKAWNEKRQEMQPAIDVQHLLQAAREVLDEMDGRP